MSQQVSPPGGDDNSSLWLGYLLIAIVLLAFGSAGYLVWTQLKPAPGTSPADADGGSGSSAAATPSANPIADLAKKITAYVAPAPASVFPLHNGSTGDEVKAFQHYLNTTYNAGLTEDGVWGSKTNAAASQYVKTTSVSQAEYNSEINQPTATQVFDMMSPPDETSLT